MTLQIEQHHHRTHCR